MIKLKIIYITTHIFVDTLHILILHPAYENNSLLKTIGAQIKNIFVRFSFRADFLHHFFYCIFRFEYVSIESSWLVPITPRNIVFLSLLLSLFRMRCYVVSLSRFMSWKVFSMVCYAQLTSGTCWKGALLILYYF